MYSSTKPKYIQVGEHQFFEDKVIDLWTGQMLLGWCVVLYLDFFPSLTDHNRFSASSAAKLYELAMKQDYLTGSAWAFSTKLTANHIWDGFIIAALLDDHK
jgi:hypothetical protein